MCNNFNLNRVENIGYMPYFDVMKGLAIILMVIGHVMLFSFNINPSEPSRFIYFNMPLFFYISGYLSYRQLDSAAVLGSRIISRGLLLLIPYIVFFVLYYLFRHNELPQVDLLIGGGIGYWFLYDLFVLSIFFLVYEYSIRNINKSWLYVIMWLLPLCVLIIIKLYVVSSNSNWGG